MGIINQFNFQVNQLKYEIIKFMNSFIKQGSEPSLVKSFECILFNCFETMRPSDKLDHITTLKSSYGPMFENIVICIDKNKIQQYFSADNTISILKEYLHYFLEKYFIFLQLNFNITLYSTFQ